MNTLIAGILPTLDDTAWPAIIAATLIIAFILFSKAIKLMLKLAVIAVMLVVIAYFLRQMGII